jgi:NADH-quinone oxidoreductase subunit N
MLAIDPFSQFFKILLTLFTGLVIVQWLLTNRGQPTVYDLPDFLCLLLGAVFGMSLMASANNLLMIFIAIESASLPSYALAGFRKRQRLSTEASLKYVVFGAASSAIMIYGMSLLYGCAGSLALAAVVVTPVSPLMAVGLAAMMVGIAFKLSAVPVHFWCPDVFQGAPIEVTTFLSVASKGAAVCLLVRVLWAFSLAGAAAEGLFMPLAVGIAVVGAVTATWGNLVAMHQTNIKRLLAYSSIAHAGYMIMGASVMCLADRGHDPMLAEKVAGAVLFYLLVYLFMNFGAFTVAAVIARRTGSEDITDYAELTRRCPVLALLLSVFLLSLFGLPGLGGFMAKFMLAVAMVSVGGALAFTLLIVLLVNTLFSLFYYLRPVYYMAFTSDTRERPSFMPRGVVVAVLVLCVLALLWTGFGGSVEWARRSGKLIVPAVPATPMARADDPSDPLPLDAQPEMR